MSWPNAVVELRTLLNDGPKDKYFYRKPVYPAPNGTNTSFKTFEYRRLTDFTTSVSPQGVFVNSVLVPVTTDDVDTGEFIFGTAPVDGDMIEASYYTNWFFDSELTTFLTNATKWLAYGDDQNSVPQGLQPTALKYAASEAYEKLAVKWSQRMSEMYRVEDSLDPKTREAIDSYAKLSQFFRETSLKMRDEFYTRSGQNLQPLYGTVLGTVPNVEPNR